MLQTYATNISCWNDGWKIFLFDQSYLRENRAPTFRPTPFPPTSVNYMIIRKITILSNTHNKTHKWYPIYTYVLKISLTELILWRIRLNFVTKNYLWTKIEPKRKYKWLQVKRSEGAEGVRAEPREDPSTCIIVNNS